MSIRYRLILRLLLASLILVSVVSWIGYLDVKHEARELFDAQLARSARLILSLVQSNPGELNVYDIQRYFDENELQKPDVDLNEQFEQVYEEFNLGHIYETKLGFQIWDNHGNLILKSSNVPFNPIAPLDNGFSYNRFDDYDWRVFSLISRDKRYRCLTAERVDVRNDLIGKIFSNLVLIFIVLIPALALTMWFAINRGLAPLHQLANQIDRRGAEKLDSLSEKNTPSEIKIITGALNQLLSRLKQALAREKRVTSDAAHELRTPLAGVRLHAELAQRANNSEDLESSIAQVILGIDRTTRLVDQLLALARLEPDKFSEQLENHNLHSIAIEEVGELANLALEKEIEMSVAECQHFTVPIDDTSMRLLIRNLLNNAINYTQPKGLIEVFLRKDQDTAYLTIQDNGPGIPREERERVLERFYRLKNHNNPGCGIGLSIVAQVVELHQAKLILSDSDHSSGLKVEVQIPLGRQAGKNN